MNVIPYTFQNNEVIIFCAACYSDQMTIVLISEGNDASKLLFCHISIQEIPFVPFKHG